MWGLIARAESNRGLGVLTRLMYQHLKPDRCLLLTLDSGYEQETSAFSNATVLPFTGTLDETVCRDWLSGLDTVVSCETYYDSRFVGWAKDLGVRSVLYVMPEFLNPGMPAPDAYWYPSTWRLDSCPPGTLLPMPCETRPFVDLPDSGPVRFVHVAGKKALGDRNGTETLFEALRRVRGTREPLVTTYAQTLDHVALRLPPWHRLLPGPSDKWEMYNAHVLVMPRRFGGLCLPVVEALTCGLAVVMSNISPNLDWPVVPVDVNPGRRYAVPCGKINTWDTDVPNLAVVLSRLASHPEQVRDGMLAARSWAEANTWKLRKGEFLRAL